MRAIVAGGFMLGTAIDVTIGSELESLASQKQKTVELKDPTVQVAGRQMRRPATKVS